MLEVADLGPLGRRAFRAQSSRSRWATVVALSGVLTLQVGAPTLANAAEGSTDVELRRKASGLYENGVRAFEGRRYREAVDQFLAADRLLPSAPLSYNIALAYENLLDVAGALRFYRDYLRRAPTASNGAKVRERVRELELTLAQRGLQQVTVQTQPPGATVVIDGEPVGVAPWTGELAPGEHSLALTLKGKKDVERTFLLPAAHAIDVSQKLEAAPGPAVAEGTPARRSSDSSAGESPATADATTERFGVWPWVTLGASGAAFIAAGTFELLRRDADDDAKNATTQLGYQDRLDAMSSHQTTARIFAGIGGALLVTGGTLLVLRTWSDDDTRTGSVSCVPTGCLGSFRTSF